jgi:hypothetical protein
MAQAVHHHHLSTQGCVNTSTCLLSFYASILFTCLSICCSRKKLMHSSIFSGNTTCSLMRMPIIRRPLLRTLRPSSASVISSLCNTSATPLTSMQVIVTSLTAMGCLSHSLTGYMPRWHVQTCYTSSTLGTVENLNMAWATSLSI